MLMDGFQTAFTATNLMFGLLGTFLGTLVGVLPGIGPALAIGLLLPICLTVNPTSALIMFAAIYYGAMYGGSTTSILLIHRARVAPSLPPLKATRWQKRAAQVQR